MRLGRKQKGLPGEPSSVSIVACAKRLYETTGDSAFDQFADMVLAHAADTDVFEGSLAKLAPTPEAVAVVRRDPTGPEEIAARVVALVAAFANSDLDTTSAGELVMYVTMHAVRFAEYQAAAGRT